MKIARHEIHFEKVWYRPEHRPKGMLLAYCDSGSLSLFDGSLRFVGRGFEIYFQSIDELSYTGARGDFINHWIHVRSGNKVALFADGGWLGFRGHLANGTKRIHDSLRSNLETNARHG